MTRHYKGAWDFEAQLHPEPRAGELSGTDLFSQARSQESETR
jgi:hypothetical protein